MDVDDLLRELRAWYEHPADELAVRRFRRACRKMDTDPAEQQRIDRIASELDGP